MHWMCLMTFRVCFLLPHLPWSIITFFHAHNFVLSNFWSVSDLFLLWLSQIVFQDYSSPCKNPMFSSYTFFVPLLGIYLSVPHGSYLCTGLCLPVDWCLWREGTNYKALFFSYTNPGPAHNTCSTNISLDSLAVLNQICLYWFFFIHISKIYIFGIFLIHRDR